MLAALVNLLAALDPLTISVLVAAFIAGLALTVYRCATYTRDLASQFNTTFTTSPLSIPPQEISTTTTGATVDCLGGDGEMNFLTEVGAFNGGTVPTVTFSFNESPTGTGSWTAMLINQTPTTFSAGGFQWINAQRQFRYVQIIATVTGSPSGIFVAASGYQQKKAFTGQE